MTLLRACTSVRHRMVNEDKPKLVIADDHGLLRQTLCQLLKRDFEVVAEADNGWALLQLIEKVRPDAILLDISMPVLNGIEAARRIQKIRPEVKLVFLTMHTDVDHVREAFQAGAKGYVVKGSPVTELIEALRTVLTGKVYVSPSVSGGAIEASKTTRRLDL